MKINNIISLLILLIFSACDPSEHLQLNPPNQITEGNFYNSEFEIGQAVNAIYRELGSTIAAAGSVADLYGELYSDNTEFIFQTAGDPVDEAISGYITRSENSRIESAWNNTYNSIYITNNIIHVIENTEIKIAENIKSRWISEAKTVRSLAYFNLVRAFGGVPLIIKKISPVEAYDYLREQPDLIYEHIISDLNEAKINLPESYTGEDVGRITRYGAAAILAKIYLTRGDQAAAQSELEMIINSGLYSLDTNGDGVVNMEDFYYLFSPDTKNSQSSILEAQYMAGVNAFNSNHQMRYMPFHHQFTLPGVPGATFRGNGVNTPSRDLITEFEGNDPRIEISVEPRYNKPSSGEFVEHPFTFKFFDPNWANPGANFSIIRYADILLMYAEVTGDAQYLNMVRERAGLSLFGSADYPSDLYPTLDLAIEHERRIELTHEMHRMFDLVRRDRAVEVLQGKGFNFDENKLLFPIPQDAIDVNPDLDQNPGY